ncbi:FAD/FMN-dependent dehydrogenase [Desulfosporosinus acidiphilus SJ4]|uniref:D-lactate dehydrogenase (cytochrome) n=1 Tax=Desulfosporosinus acidiphilus (strain DSM 22704 / JCM 16185 / SJ4) TaxID=646529 RepID=I4D0H2_DESAJ|nr:FAD-binding oxidoreductase [Desulfosporosinus acidiphilus]AFM39296.1 FAD/FMN-dependent dehydrogenase [Desulfosporosinus acidiphilus SJ4]
MSNVNISKLKGIVGDEHVIDSPSEMAKYLKGQGKPAVVVLPGNTSEVSNIVKLANDQNVKLTVGGAVVDTQGLSGGIAMVMSRMNRILEMDMQNLVAVVEPGLLHKDFLLKVAETGLNFPPEPYELETSSIGGCFAIGDSDSKSFEYGPTRTFLLGFEMVLPTGEIMDIGNKCIKNVSGLDFIHFAVGSQGTFGIFTKLLVKLLPAPEARRAVIGTFASMHKANETFNTLIKRNVLPTRMNLINGSLANIAKPGTEGQLVIIDLQGFKESGKNIAHEIAAVLTLGGGTDVKIIEDAAEYDQVINGWLKVRADLNSKPEQTVEFTVGPMKMPQALAQLEALTGDLGAYPGVIVEGLLGYVCLALPEGTDKLALARSLNKLAMSLGGNVKGLLGHKLKAEVYNDAEMWKQTTSLLRELRQQFDPKGILSPGVSLEA